MKLRQKLAVVLASAMVVTAVPVVTSAASTNSIPVENVIVNEKHEFKDSTSAPSLNIKFDSAKEKETFYLTLTGAVWNYDTTTNKLVDEKTGTPAEYTHADATLTVIDKTTLKVETQDSLAALDIALLTTLTADEAKVTIERKGAMSTVTEGTYTFAKTTAEIGTATVGKAPSFIKDGKIATITLTEAYKGAFNTTQDQFALIELNNSEFVFDMQHATAPTPIAGTGYTQYTMTAKYGFGFQNKGTNVTVYVSDDLGSMFVKLPKISNGDSVGTVELNDLYVKSTVKNPTEGTITVDISGDVEAVNDQTVATIGNYDVKLTASDVVEMKAGKQATTTITLTEGVNGTLTDNREMTFTLTNGYFVDAKLDANKKVNEADTKAELAKVITSITHTAGTTTTTTKVKTDIAALITDVEVDENNKVVGFAMEPSVDATAVDTYAIKLDVAAALGQTGEIAVEVASRDFETKTAPLANISEAFTMSTETAVLKAGLKDQLAGKITLTEGEAATFVKGSNIVVELPVQSGLEFSTKKTELPEVTVTSGDLKVGTATMTATTKADGTNVIVLTVPVSRTSKEASTIEIANFHVDTDRTLADGTYDVTVAGTALTELSDVITVEDFIQVGTPEIEVGANGLLKGTSTFVIGESKYVVNGVEKTMNAQSFIQDPGYTMIPVRYVAEAFGVAGTDILFSNGTATIFAGNRTIQLTNGSDIAVVNGAQVKMGTKVVIKEGRTYAPVGEVARLLGISTEWDNTTKTATFTNK